MVEEIAYPHAAARHLCAVGWADALLCRADEPVAQFHLLEPVNLLVKVKDDMSPVADKDAIRVVKAVLGQSLELVEEGRDVDHASAADQVDAGRVDKTGRQDVEIVRVSIGDDGVASIVTALGTAAELGAGAKDVDELAFALIAPLGAADDGGGHAGEDATGW